jgi:hypothetical protein
MPALLDQFHGSHPLSDGGVLKLCEVNRRNGAAIWRSQCAAGNTLGPFFQWRQVFAR